MKQILIINNKYDKSYMLNVIKHHILYEEMYGGEDKNHLTIKNGCNVKDINYNDYDEVYFNKHTCYEDFDTIIEIISKKDKTKFILYIDEWWQLPKKHQLFKKYNENYVYNNMSKIIRECDEILTYGNDLLVNEIQKMGGYNVVYAERYSGYTNIDTNIDVPVFGIVPNEYDLSNIVQLSGIDFSNKFWEHNKIVLVGFTNKSLSYNKLEDCLIDTTTKDNIWITYEKIITNNYALCSEEYKEFLLKYLPNEKYKGDINKEPYKRIWKQDIDDDTIYYNILLKPMIKNKYNQLLYDIESDMAKKTIINGKFVQVLNTIDYPKLNISKNIKRNMSEMIFEFRQKVLFPIEAKNNNPNKIFKNE